MMQPFQLPSVPKDAPFNLEQRAWINGYLAGLFTGRFGSSQMAPPFIFQNGGAEKTSKEEAYSKNNPFKAPLLVNRILTGHGSGKDTRHFEISLEGSDLTYEVGDALGICPTNCSQYVDDLLKAAGFHGNEIVPLPERGTSSLREAFLVHYDIAKPPRTLVEIFADRADAPNLKRMFTPELGDALKNYLWGREIIDLFLEYPTVKFTPEEFVRFLKKLSPRLYSIASSIKVHPNAVHLTVAIVRYEAHGRKRKGVCSTFLAESVSMKSNIPVFVHDNKNFRLPADGNRPIIMIGPGTGVAPFRAFLEERRATGAKGKNWLFFGDQHRATDFLYQEEFEAMLKEGILSKLDLAFSRDQAEKVYVQHQMLEKAAGFYAWLQEGAHVYVCGDASRMAKDVNDALYQIIKNVGGLSDENTADYVQKLKSEKRYQRDVY